MSSSRSRTLRMSVMEDMPETHVSHEPWIKEGLSIIVIGASGDLAKKKTFPSLLSLFADNLLPRRLVIYGYARSNITSEALREKIRPYLEKKDLDESVIDDFLGLCHYQSGARYGDVESWKGLNNKIVAFEDEIEETRGISKANRLFYFAIPPNVFAETGEAIKTTCMSKKGFSRMIVEKPFGKDLESCKEILARVRLQDSTHFHTNMGSFFNILSCLKHTYSLVSILTKRTYSVLTIILGKRWYKISWS